MFEVDPERSWVDPAAGPISSLIQSLNTPLVAAGSHPAENVQSWILSRTGTGGGSEVFVFFHLTESNQGVLYRWDGGPIASAQHDQVVEEAMGFCESMGFMMDNLNFGQLPQQKRNELLQTLPPFVQDLAALQLNKPMEEIPLSVANRVVDPVAEFARARQAMAESGQATTNDFAAAHEDGSGQFDPSQLMSDMGAPPPGLERVSEPAARRAAAAAAADSDDLQIEITEVEGLELVNDPPVVTGTMPAAAQPKPRASGTREIVFEEEPPLVVGAAVSARPVAPAPGAPAAVPPAQPTPVVAGGPMPPTRGRERTPAGQVAVFDDTGTGAGTATAPAAAARPPISPPAAATAPMVPFPGAPMASPSRAKGEFSVDDLLDDMDAPKAAAPPKAASGPTVELDAGGLDDILDGVESSKPPQRSPVAKPSAKEPPKPVSRPAAVVPPKPEPEVAISMDLDVDVEASVSSPDEALVALEALGVGDEPALTPAPGAGRAAGDLPWDTEPGRVPKATNGNGSAGARNGAGAPVARLEITTDELARLLSML